MNYDTPGAFITPFIPLTLRGRPREKLHLKAGLWENQAIAFPVMAMSQTR
jgi:hypothetical protein